MEKNSAKSLIWLQYVVIISVILYFGSNVWIPLSYATLISFILYPICRWLQNKGLGKMLSILVSLSIIIILVLGLLYLLLNQFSAFMHEWPRLQAKLQGTLQEVMAAITEKFNITALQQQTWIKDGLKNSGGSFLDFVSGTLASTARSALMIFLIPIYSALILFYRKQLADLGFYLLPSTPKDYIITVLHEVVLTFYNFIKGMALVYLIIGVLNSIGLYFLGVPNPILFGFIASILTFIPYVGIMIGALLPMTIAWLEHDNIWYALGVAGVFGIVQVLEGNLIFPFAVSGRLKVNPLFTIIAIFIGGILWGVSGMILFIPFLAIAKLVLERTKGMESIAKVLGTE